MDRLTGWDKDHAYNLKCFEGDGCEDMDTSKCDFCEHHIAVYDRLARFEDTVEQGRLVMLPVPIGAPVYVKYEYQDTDGSIQQGVEETFLSGYVKEGDREFYTTYDKNHCTCDFSKDEIYTTHEAAKSALMTQHAGKDGEAHGET